MSLGLSQFALPAELMRGCRLKQEFWDKASMLRDAWALFGNPTVNEGIVLNGTTQHTTRPLQGQLNSAEQTIHIIFYPTFAADDGLSRYMMDTDVNRTLVSKDGGNALNVFTGGAGVIASPFATYGALWVQNGRNVLSASLTTGANTAWLNGTQIGTTANAWTPGNPGVLFMGCRNAVANYFPGTISSLYIGKHLSTLQEHLDIWNNDTWDWRDLLTYDFEFNTGSYDPVNNRTYDARTAALYAVLGDGAGTGEPTQARGYQIFDGVDDYLSGIANPTGLFTIMGMKDIGTGWEFFSTNDLTEWTPIFTSGGFTGNLTALMVAPSVLTPTQELDAERAIRATLGAQL